MIQKLKSKPWGLALSLLAVLVTIVILVVVVRRSVPTNRIWLKAPDWSRAQIIGTSRINDPAPIVIDDAGTVYIVMIRSDAELSRPRIVALDPQAEILWDRTLEVIMDRPDKPRLLWNGQSLYLFWLDTNSLYSAELDQTGNLLAQPHLLSSEQNVESYSIAANTAGNVSVWYAGSRRVPGLYALTLGEEADEPSLVDLLGIRPSIQYDDENRLHATWGQHPPGFGDNKILYASYADGDFTFGREITLARPVIAPTSLLQGPFFGMDKTTSTVIWSVEVRTGMEAGRTDTSFVSFPNGEPSVASAPASLFVPASVLEDYDTATNDSLIAGRRVALVPGGFAGTTSASDFVANREVADELVFAYTSTLPHMWRKVASQVSLLYFQDGLPTYHQLLSFTRSASSAPTVVSDRAGYLYVTWVETAEEGFSVFLAGTSPGFDQTLSPITMNDVGLLAGETIFGLLSGIVVAPIAVVLWMIVPLFILLVTGFARRGDDSFSNPGTIISLLLTLIFYLGIKAGTTPEFGVYVPFSAWLPIAEWLRTPLQYLVPVFITLFSLWATWRFAYRRGTNSLMYLTMILIALDGTLTMSIYGILFLGAL